MDNLLVQANNCYMCKNPKCKANCPIETDIPNIIKLYKEGKILEAGKILFDNNPLSLICSIVCPHEKQCLGHCIRGIKDEPVKFYEIEQYISKTYLESLTLEKPKRLNKKVAVVGSGPASITIAIELALKGYDITIFEKNEKIGGVLQYGIPEFRLPREIMTILEKLLKSLGVKVRINSLIGPVLTLSKLFSDGYEAIFLGTGVWNPKRLEIKGESFGHVHYAIDYLRSPQLYELGDKVVVIGAGNVAMDAARSAKHYGSKDVRIAYRRGIEDMPATKHEICETQKEGVIFDLYKSPVEIVDEGIIFAKTEYIENEDGSKKLVTIENSEELFECDSIIISISQNAKNTIVINNKGLDTKKDGLLVTDVFGQTTREGVFACGDVTYGAKTVIEAVVTAKKVAQSMDFYCKNK